MSQKRIEKPARREEVEETEEKSKDLTPAKDEVQQSADETVGEIDAALKENQERKDSMDELMGEVDEAIDAALEGTTADQWVQGYVQRGGQ